MISPKSRINIGLSKSEIKYIAGSYNLTYDEVLHTIEDILEETLINTTIELGEWINKKVPKRTGRLRDDLIANLNSSRVKEGIMKMILGTRVEYAKFVNAMTTSQVAHSGETGYAFNRLLILNDPEAVGHFFRELIFYAKERVQINLRKAKNRFLGFGSFSKRISRAMG